MADDKFSNGTDNEGFPWARGVFDAHCHPTEVMASIDDISRMKARVLTIMSSRIDDQHLVAEAADRIGFSHESSALDGDCEKAPCQVVPAFGWHPWFSHHLYNDLDLDPGSRPDKASHYKSILTPPPDNDDFMAGLPDPYPLSEYLKRAKDYLIKYPLALVGEIGLDRSFRIPDMSSESRNRPSEPGRTPGTRDGRKLSPCRVDIDHQRKILQAQLRLAAEMQRPVSIHGVAAHGLLFEMLQGTWKGHEKVVISSRLRKRRGSVQDAHVHEEGTNEDEDQPEQPKPFPPRICLHSYSGPQETLRQYFSPFIPATVFVSFSKLINFSTPASSKAVEVIKSVPDDFILLESDAHHAGERMDQLLVDMARIICEIKNWDLDEGVAKLAQNWKHFVLGKS
jgi:Tat protein secretion system quality control protein TatD with DNase activity